MTDIISHAEGAKKGIASNHGDPEHYWRGLELSYTMDTFRKAVAAKMEEMEDKMTEETVRKIVKEEIAKIPKAPEITQKAVLDALEDKWIHKFTDLPEWAQPEVRELIEMGALKGVSLGETVEDTVIDATLNSYIRPILVAYRAAKVLVGDVPKDAMVETFRQMLASFVKED